MTYEKWLEYYQQNPRRQEVLDREISWDERTPMTPDQIDAMAHSLQRFELGESGDGKLLLSKAAGARDEVYLAALRLFVVEEQKHSALFLKCLGYLGRSRLAAHWSDAAFTSLRRALGLRLELMLFLTAEVIALDYFELLERGVPDPVIRLVATRVLTDEYEHVRFQIQRLGDGFAETPRPGRAVVRAAWTIITIGAAAVVALDHRRAIAISGGRPARFFVAAVRNFRAVAAAVLDAQGGGILGPTEALANSLAGRR